MRGFVLLMMLVYMQVFSLIAMQGVTSVVAQKKLINRRMVADHHRRQMLVVMTQIDRINDLACEVKINASSRMPQQNISWWKRHGCHLLLENENFFYVREALGIDLCGVISNQYNQSVAPAYYRNTLLHVSEVNAYQSSLMQDTIALPSQLPTSCGYAPKSIKPGRQMLRWL